MHLDRKLCALLQRLHKLRRLIRNQKPRHILDTDGIRAHLLNLLCHVGPVFERVSITQSIRERDLRVPLLFVCRFHRCLQVPQVIKAVENTDDVNAVRNRLLHEIFHYIVRVMVVTQNILAAEKHLQLRVFKTGTQLAEPLPRVFFQKAQGSVKRCPTPALHRMVSHFVHLVYNRQHLLGGHSCRNQGLMGIAQNSLCNL